MQTVIPNHVTRAPPPRYANRMDRDEVMRVLRAFESAGLEYVLIDEG
jgi:hypothetical protein